MVQVADVLIRNFPARDPALVDERAAQLGISLTEFLRRHLQREARRTSVSITTDDLRNLSTAVADLADNGVMVDAWS